MLSAVCRYHDVVCCRSGLGDHVFVFGRRRPDASLESPQKLLKYSCGTTAHWEKTIVWSEVTTHKAAPSVIFDATMGKQLKHKSTMNNMVRWIGK